MTLIARGPLKMSGFCRLILSIALIAVAQANDRRADGAANKLAVEPTASHTRQHYFGTLIGPLLNGAAHGVSGEVYAVDEQTLFIRNFNYDGRAPDAYFWSNALGAARPQDGFIVPDEKGSTKPLERYANKDIVLRLPEGKTLREIHWLSVWSRQLAKSVGDIQMPHSSSAFVVPRPLEIGALSELAHGVKSAPITIVDAQTFLVPDFHYDGLAPDAYFWLTRGASGLAAGPASLKLRDENGSASPLHKYQGATLVISLPDEFTIYDFDFFGVWCKKFAANFGQALIPQSARVPPSPKMLGIKPENKLNCEILHDDLGFEIRWVLDGDDIVLQLVGKIEPGEYMAFGLGKDDSRSDMNNADAVLAWVERHSGQVHAVDYFLGAKQQCKLEAGTAARYTGSCPDTKLEGGSDSLTLLHGAIVNGYSMVTFKRPQLGVDEKFDQHVYSDGQQSVIWAIGSLNEHKEAGYHRLRTHSNMFIDFARNPQWNCPIPDLNASMHSNLPVGAASQLEQSIAGASSPAGQLAGQSSELAPSSAADFQLETGARQQPASGEAAWFIPQIVCPNERTFYAQIGPTAGRKGYAGLTGRPIGWAPPTSWYINGLMIPELVVERGQAYRFIVEGGNEKLNSARRHPLYLTDSPEGGFNFKTDEERQRERIYGGVAQRASDGQFVPTAEGRLCEWRPTNSTLAEPDRYATFSAYQRSLKLECAAGQASVLKFAPDANTPDTIYYQCYTNRLMGWRIRVVDSCADYLGSLQGAASRSVASVVLPAPSTPHRYTASLPKRFNRFNMKERLERRQSPDQSDLRAQYSEQRMLAFDLPPQHFGQSHQRQQHGGLPMSLNDNLVAEDDFLDFGDELAASEESLARQNNSFLGSQQAPSNANLSLYEQILKMAPSDLEILDESQLELASALALAAAGAHSPQLPAHFPAAIPLQASQEAPSAATSKEGKLSINKVPKSLHAYMRRLASFYYPVQQQLISMLAPASGWPQSPPSGDQQQQASALAQLHQQIVAASSAIPASISSNPAKPASGATASKPHGASGSEPVAAASGSSFSLASLVPKPKIDLSKSSLGKKFNKFRIKSGRKYEPQTAGSSANKQQSRPPTPDNEFNYDIFNNQLLQLEQQQRQLQSLEGFAAAASALMAHQQSRAPQWQAPAPGPPAAPAPQLEPVDSSFYAHNFGAGSGRSPQQTSATPMSQAQLEQQDALLFSSSSNMFEHQNEPLQEHQPGTSHKKQQLEVAAGGQPGAHEQAVFITKLALQQAPNLLFAPASQQEKGQQQDQMSESVRGLGSSLAGTPTASNEKQAWRQPEMIQSYYGQAQSSRARPSYLDSTDYLSRPSGGGGGGGGPSVQQQTSQDERPNAGPQEKLSELLRGTESGRQRQVVSAAPSAGMSAQLAQMGEPDLDHMLAIERYSKQPSERRPASIVDPSTGEEVLLVEEAPQVEPERQQQQPQQQQEQFHRSAKQQAARNHTQAPRYSAMLIDRHVVAPSTGAPPSSPQSFSLAGRGELLDAEQSAPDLKRLNASAQGAMLGTEEPRAQLAAHQHSSESGLQEQFLPATTSEPAQPVLARPSTAATPLDFFASDPPAAATTPSSLLAFRSLAPPPPAGLSLGFQLPAGSTAGALMPSAGPLSWRAASQSPVGRELASELVLKSNLIEPIKSTLVPAHLDITPFTPLEVVPAHQQHNYAAASNLQQFRLRPPPLVESMLSQYADPFRPEPPVRVASYLAQQLAGQTSQFTSAPAPSSNSVTNKSDNSTQAGGHLIILKPSPVGSQQQPHTYALRPEFVASARQSNLEAGHTAGRQIGDLVHTASEQASRRLAANQFDRLSSLSSPPSTSILLGASKPADPMLASNSIQSFTNSPPAGYHMGPALRFTLSSASTSTPSSVKMTYQQQQQQAPADVARRAEAHLKSSAVPDANNNNNNNSNNSTATTQTTADAQGPKSAGAGQTNQAPPEGQRQQPQQQNNWLADGLYGLAGESGAPQRDNSTDNAILSHVMSLISANAVPAPPVMPLASYAPADYFLPISSLDAHLAHRTALLRARSIRS